MSETIVAQVGAGPRAGDREWVTPGEPASRRVLAVVAGSALAVAVLVPVQKVGVGWTAAGVVMAAAVVLLARPELRPSAEPRGPGRPRTAPDPLYIGLAVALASAGAIRAAEWLFVLCALASVGCLSLALSPGRSAWALAFGSVSAWIAGFLALPWLFEGSKTLRRERGGARIGWSVAVGTGLLLVFGALFASADAAFARLVESLTPQASEVDGTGVVVFGVAALFVGGVAHLVAAPMPEPDGRRRRGPVRLIEWALPVGVLLGLFVVFIGVQVAVLFGGDTYVSSAGMTYAGYARSGFWQLLVVTGLVLAVIAVAARVAPVGTGAERAWLRVLLGGLTAATLVVVVSAISRLWLYQQTYGFTVLRLLVGVAEVWLGLVCLMVLAAGRSLRAAWLPKAVLTSALAALLGLVVLNPERFVAEWNVDRYAGTGRIDTGYLGRLSADAVPALAALPEPVRACVLANHKITKDRPLEWNWGRSQAAGHLAAVGHCADAHG
ncbi:DUF4153 domain-containing protein [Actinokineospora guangxiensis]|uniref:DUF4153 domain-containing protein n=1 Tax=Actinokineospora guangxiensis TaxID=1490288 RepID=A0ABW0ER22_9PSEU